ncbi:MAG: 50S ribosomal protein L25/general stress protein Ctc, partial [Alphaproteobacteria bacterium]
MAEIMSFKVQARESGGTGAARAVRRTGRIPGILYGENAVPTPISVDAKQLSEQMHRKSFFVTLYELDIDGKKQRVLPRDLQLDPVTDIPLHIDFLRVGTGTRIRVNVPVAAANEAGSPGIKRGGVLNIVRHEIEVICRADAIPQRFTIDLDGLDVGDSVKISAVKLPEGVRPVITDRDFTILTIAAPTVVADEAAAAAAA